MSKFDPSSKDYNPNAQSPLQNFQNPWDALGDYAQQFLNVDSILDVSEVLNLDGLFGNNIIKKIIQNVTDSSSINLIFGMKGQETEVKKNKNNENWQIQTMKNLKEGLDSIKSLTSSQNNNANQRGVKILYMQTHGSSGPYVINGEGENYDLSDIKESTKCKPLGVITLEHYSRIKDIIEKNKPLTKEKEVKIQDELETIGLWYFYEIEYSQIETFFEIVRSIEKNGIFIMGGCSIASNNDASGFMKSFFKLLDRPDLTIYACMDLVSVPNTLLDIAMPGSTFSDGWGYINSVTNGIFKSIRNPEILHSQLQKGEYTGKIVLKSKGSPLELEKKK